MQGGIFPQGKQSLRDLTKGISETPNTAARYIRSIQKIPDVLNVTFKDKKGVRARLEGSGCCGGAASQKIAKKKEA